MLETEAGEAAAVEGLCPLASLSCKMRPQLPLQLEETVRTLNNLYAEVEKLGSQSYLEGCLACLTAYTIFLCMETHNEKVLKKIAKYIQEQNKKIYVPQGLLLTDPIEQGLRVVRNYHL
uniref:Golgin subfamily A member 7 n=1 Tax=Laticauda laticaudata TaxID=8630 RepID=A0A8C5RSV7_LATLA